MPQEQKILHRDGFASLHGGLLARKGSAQPAVADLDQQRRARRGDREGEEQRAAVPSSPAPRLRKTSPPADRPRVTMRLTERQQRLLRLVGAATNRSQQEILSLALDQHLTKVIGEELGHCRCLRRLVMGDMKPGEPCDQKKEAS
ncbi:MAG: hypothetical protein AAGA69_09290 [Pseudomonadota bacterium]